MKIIRITKNCALRFLEEAHKPGGRAEHLVEAHENMLFKDGAINVLGSRKKHTTIVRFLPAMEMENEKLKEQFPTMQGEAIRMMLMGPLGSAASLLGYFFLTEEQENGYRAEAAKNLNTEIEKRYRVEKKRPNDGVGSSTPMVLNVEFVMPEQVKEEFKPQDVIP